MSERSPLQLKSDFQETRKAFYAGNATQEQLFSAADAYIDALKAYKKRRKLHRLAIPTRAKLLR